MRLWKWPILTASIFLAGCVAHPLLWQQEDSRDDGHSVQSDLLLALVLANPYIGEEEGPAYYSIADTGQEQCFDTSEMVDCADASYPGQDGAFASVPAPRNFSGPLFEPEYPQDPYVLDHTTGLIWKYCTEGLTGMDCSGGTSSDHTHSMAVSACSQLNSLHSGNGYAGRNTWRLPSLRELLTLFYFGDSDYREPALRAGLETGSSVAYWSDTMEPGSPNIHWAVQYFTIVPVGTALNSSQIQTLCVASGALPEPRYMDNGDGTVTDSTNGLVWQKCLAGQNNAVCSGPAMLDEWQQALQYCSSLSLASLDWRLPSINELQVLLDRTYDNPTIDTSFFPTPMNHDIWSSTTYPFNASYAQTVDLSNGSVNTDFKTGTDRAFRCVASI